MRDADGYCRWLGSYFYAEGYDRDDICQEAMLAAWLAPSGLERVAARRRVLDILKAARRRPRFVELVEVETPDNVVDAVDAGDRLRAVLAVAPPRTSALRSRGSCAASRLRATRRRSRSRSGACAGRSPRDPRLSERLLDSKEVAARLGVPESWVRESARSGAIPCVARALRPVRPGRRGGVDRKLQATGASHSAAAVT